MKNVPFFNYPHVYRQYKSLIKPKLLSILDKGSYILQKELKRFENNLAKFLNSKYAIGVADGTNAIILALRAAGMKKGDEAIISSHTYIATASAIHDCGGIPVVVDCKDDLMIDERKIEKAITKKTKFIIPTQLNGRVCKMDKILNIAKKNKLTVIEDGAQSIGAKFKRKNSTTFGLAGTISFYPAKILGCFGDGGAIITNNKKFAKKLLELRDHGRDKNGKVVSWGTNSRLDNIQAMVLDIKLRYLRKDIARRRQIAKMYDDGLKDISALKLPPAPNLNIENFDVFQNYEILAEHRDSLRNYLSQKGIGTLVQWNGQPIHSIKGIKVKKSSYKYTDKIFKKIVMLPMNTSLKNNEIMFVIKKIKEFYN
jgi:dTDP-4-amino-4,6-dideoxygalactose transaminase